MMNDLYSPVVLSKDEIELINIIRSMEDEESELSVVELLRLLYKMNRHYRIRAIRVIMDIADNYAQQKKIENAINYGKRYGCANTPKAQFGNLTIFNTKI